MRVIRGYKLDSPFAPDEGYRYDGILYVAISFHFCVVLRGGRVKTESQRTLGIYCNRPFSSCKSTFKRILQVCWHHRALSIARAIVTEMPRDARVSVVFLKSILHLKMVYGLLLLFEKPALQNKIDKTC